MEEPGTRKQQKKKNWTGLKLFLGLIILVFIFAGLYLHSVYTNVVEAAESIYEPVDQEETRGIAVDLEQSDPISILLLGVDTGELGRTEQGRSDSMVVATINPNTQQTTLLSIPRDTYSKIVGYGDGVEYFDKINHAYAYGEIKMAIDSVQELLEIPIDYYVTINMAGLEKIVDAVGGIDVDSPFGFTFTDYTEEGEFSYSFTEGPNHLDGAHALAFARMRYEDPEGDVGRQSRQRIVIEAILKKLLSSNLLVTYRDVLTTVSGNVETNFQMEDYESLLKNDYLEATKNIQQEELTGTDELMDDIYYHFVEDKEFSRVESLLRKELEI